MKKMLVLLAAFALTAGAASAQTATSTPASQRGMAYKRAKGTAQKMTPEQHADRQAQRLTQELGLSADQTAKVRAAALAQAQEAQALRTQSAAAAGRQGQAQEMKALKEKYDGQLKAVLTADQYAKYDQMQSNKMNKHQQFKPSRIKAGS